LVIPGGSVIPIVIGIVLYKTAIMVHYPLPMSYKLYDAKVVMKTSR